MRLLVRALAVLGALLALALVVLAVGLPRLVDRPEVRARIEAAAREATGRDVRFDGLAIGILPPRVRVLRPVVAATTPGEPPLFSAEEAALRVALLPLLARTLVVDSLDVVKPTLRIVRMPRTAPAPETAPAPVTGAAAVASNEGEGLRLAVRHFTLHNGTVVLEDHGVAPTVTWTLADIQAEATGTSVAAPIDFSLSGRLDSGGLLRAKGTSTTSGTVDLHATLEAVELAAAKPYAGKTATSLAGRLEGTVHVQGSATAQGSVDADLKVTNADAVVASIAVHGPLALHAQLRGEPANLSGKFDVDATAAELVYQGGFTKPVGTPATVSGQLVHDAQGTLGVDDVHLKVKNLDAQGTLRTGRRTRLELRAKPFDVGGWESLLPALGGAGLHGEIVPGTLAVTTEPLELEGAPAFNRLIVQFPAKPPVAIDGSLEVQGDVVRTRGLVVHIAGQPFTVAAELTALATHPHYRVQLGANQIDSKALINAFSQRKDVFEGPLTLKSDFSGPVASGAPLLETVRGTARIDVGRGRLRGVSLLRGTFDQLGSFGELALAAGRAQGGKDLQRFYEDEFESIGGTFVVADGHATTDDLKMIYRDYMVDLRGALGLADQSVDMTGKLTIDKELDAKVAAQTAAGASAAAANSRVIPLAHVTGTLSEPKVSIRSEDAASFAASYALGRERGKLERKLDEKLGQGAGREVLDALDGLLGGSKKKQSQ
ncbi:MAG TPA: AsmA-like C-terminal region-containing protein [Myxococcota bacterium]|nr:AsmA-like C-terminal region-containing protein [Myxococcota bacterium]